MEQFIQAKCILYQIKKKRTILLLSSKYPRKDHTAMNKKGKDGNLTEINSNALTHLQTTERVWVELTKLQS